MLRIWIFFNKQTIYLEETTAQRKNQIAERAGANLGRSHSWKYRHPQQSTYPWEVFSVDLFAVFKAIYWGNCMWFNLPRLTAPFIWFREFELDYGYLMTYCFSRKISGREIAGVWKLAKLVTADWRLSKMVRNVGEWCEHITILKWFVSRFSSQRQNFAKIGMYCHTW